MDELFDEFFDRAPGSVRSDYSLSFAPAMEIGETDKEVKISAELPGLDEKDVEVTCSGNLLTVKGEKKAEKEEEDGDFWHRERSYGYFERSVQLPEGVDAEKAAANFKKGVLTVTVPKKPEAQSSRRTIDISVN